MLAHPPVAEVLSGAGPQLALDTHHASKDTLVLVHLKQDASQRAGDLTPVIARRVPSPSVVTRWSADKYIVILSRVRADAVAMHCNRLHSTLTHYLLDIGQPDAVASIKVLPVP